MLSHVKFHENLLLCYTNKGHDQSHLDIGERKAYIAVGCSPLIYVFINLFSAVLYFHLQCLSSHQIVAQESWVFCFRRYICTSDVNRKGWWLSKLFYIYIYKQIAFIWCTYSSIYVHVVEIGILRATLGIFCFLSIGAPHYRNSYGYV